MNDIQALDCLVQVDMGLLETKYRHSID